MELSPARDHSRAFSRYNTRDNTQKLVPHKTTNKQEKTMTTATTTTAYYTKTTLIQYGNTFEALKDFQCAVAGSPTNEEALNHLVACIEDQCFEDVSGDAKLNLNGLNAYAYASALVLNEEACKGNGHEFEIYTNFQEADEDNWNNPLS